MVMLKFDVLIVGGGPAGMCAALEAGKHGLAVLLVDENSRPGGQLFKQIHKFFGSEAHSAGVRGFHIGEEILAEIEKHPNITVWLDSLVYSAIDSNNIEIVHEDSVLVVRCEKLIVATGAIERGLAFPGWTLPGVMGAGALQTMLNINRVLPGKNLLMLGSGNVGLIVAYQFMQAGGRNVTLVEAAKSIGGYGVHASKIRRHGAVIKTSTTIKSASGDGAVREVELVSLDEKFDPIPGTETSMETDLIAIAVGLFPLMELLRMIGCGFVQNRTLGGWIPLHDKRLETTVRGVYIAGDVTGIEEASTAMEEGRLAAWSVTSDLGRCSSGEYEGAFAEISSRLDALRSGPFGLPRHEGKKAVYAAMEPR
jgi:thioredoxin reductase